jgi:hypothetical protein
VTVSLANARSLYDPTILRIGNGFFFFTLNKERTNMQDVQFKHFLFNENRVYLGQRIGDILNAMQDLTQNAKGMGTRQLVKNSEGIVNQLRRILHTHWTDREKDNLKRLQKVAVAVQSAIEEKDDLEGILASGVQELEKIIGNMDVPINQLGAPSEAEQPKEVSATTGEPQGQPPEQPEQPPEAAPQAPGAPQAPQGSGMVPGPGAPGMPPGPMPGMM